MDEDGTEQQEKFYMLRYYSSLQSKDKDLQLHRKQYRKVPFVNFQKKMQGIGQTRADLM